MEKQVVSICRSDQQYQYFPLLNQAFCPNSNKHRSWGLFFIYQPVFSHPERCMNERKPEWEAVGKGTKVSYDDPEEADINPT